MSFLLVASSAVTLTLFSPFFPIDETRYITVAWEMKLYHSFIVPMLNGLPYSHKPPFLFWLINLDWTLFGVNEKTLRFIPALFSLFNIMLVYRIAILLWNDRKIARYATIILSATGVYLVSSALVMFDILLTFWVLVGILGLLLMSKNEHPFSWLLLAASIGGGILTKRPVVFVHVLPASLLYFLWRPQGGKTFWRWYLEVLMGVCVGIGLVLIWVIPAVIQGGETYKQAILWGQTANRVVASFAHKRSIFWYVPLLPAMLFPWIFIRPSWYGLKRLKQDKSSHFILVWAGSTFVLFSLISGKQMHYLIPMLPAINLLFAKNMASYSFDAGKENKRSQYPIAAMNVLLGIILLCLTLVKMGSDVGHISFSMIFIPGLGLMLMGGFLFFVKPGSVETLLKLMAASSIGFIILLFAGTGTLLERYDVTPVAKILSEKQQQGYDIVHYKKYHGQYQFFGRLRHPLVVFNDKDSIATYLQTHDKVILISYEKPKKKIDAHDILYQKRYLNKKVVIWNNTGMMHFLNPNSKNNETQMTSSSQPPERREK